MSKQSWQEVLVTAQGDGTALTAASAASCLPAAAKFTLPNNFFDGAGKVIKVTALGRISCAVTTPGTARFDVRFGSTVVWDSAALNLNTTAQTTVPWILEVWLTCRAVGQSTTATVLGIGRFQSEAVVGSAADTAGGNGSLLCPVGAPAVGTGFDSTASQAVDLYFTQTVATGSLTLHQYILEAIN